MSSSSTAEMTELGAAARAPDTDFGAEVTRISGWLKESVPEAERNAVAEKLVRGGFVEEDASKWADMEPDFIRESLGLTALETVRVRHSLTRTRFNVCTASFWKRMRDAGFLTLLLRLVTLTGIAVAIYFLYEELDEAQEAGILAKASAEEATAAATLVEGQLVNAEDRINTTETQLQSLDVPLLVRLAEELPPLEAALTQLLLELSNDTVAALVLQVKAQADATDERLNDSFSNLTAAVNDIGVDVTHLETNLTREAVLLHNTSTKLGEVSAEFSQLQVTVANESTRLTNVSNNLTNVTDSLGSLASQSAIESLVASRATTTSAVTNRTQLTVSTDDVSIDRRLDVTTSVNVEAGDTVIILHGFRVICTGGDCRVAIRIVSFDGGLANVSAAGFLGDFAVPGGEFLAFSAYGPDTSVSGVIPANPKGTTTAHLTFDAPGTLQVATHTLFTPLVGVERFDIFDQALTVVHIRGGSDLT